MYVKLFKAELEFKIGTRDFQNSPPFERLHVFMWQSVKILSTFKTLTLIQIF